MKIVSGPDGPSAREWDAFAARRPDSTFCHMHGWSAVIERALGHEATMLAAIDDSGIRGILPLVDIRSPFFGRCLVSMPFLSYGGPIGSPEAKRLLCERASALAWESGADWLQLRMRTPLDPDGGPDPPALAPDDRSLAPDLERLTVVLDLPPDPEILWEERLSAKVRSQVRRPRKEGMVARFGTEQIDPFYEVFSRNMRDLGIPVLPRRLFHEAAAAFPGATEVGVVYHGDRPLAAGLGFAWNGELEMTWGASLREHRRMAPNMFLTWSFLERAIERDLRVFNFGRCRPGDGTHRFKSQWADARDLSLPWARWSRAPAGVDRAGAEHAGVEPAGTRAAAEDVPGPRGGPLIRHAWRVWRHLPLALTNRLGPPIARLIP